MAIIQDWSFQQSLGNNREHSRHPGLSSSLPSKIILINNFRSWTVSRVSVPNGTVAQNVLTRICSSSTFTKKNKERLKRTLKINNSARWQHVRIWYSNKTAILWQFPCDIFPVSQCVNPMWWKQKLNTTFHPLIPWFPPTTIWSLPKGPRHRLWLRIWGRYCYPAKASACTLPCPFRFNSVGFCKTQSWCPNSPWKNIDVRCATHTYISIYIYI